jgi:hypothetical protein
MMHRSEPASLPNREQAAVADDRLLIDIFELRRLTSLSLSTLRRMDASRDIPGRVTVRRRILFIAEVIREWVRASLPDRDGWAAIEKRRPSV